MPQKYDLEQIATMMRQGAHYQEIADVYGVTKSAISGLVSRNAEFFAKTPRNPVGFYGAKVMPLVFGNTRTYKPRAQRKPKPEFGQAYNGPASLRVSMVDVGAKQCRWPTNANGEAFHMCGHVTLQGKSYCRGHFNLAHEAR